MHILFVGFVDINNPRGCTIHTRELIRNLKKLGHQVTLFAQGNKSNWKEKFWDTGTFLNRKNRTIQFFFMFLSMLRMLFYMFKFMPYYDLVYARDSIAGTLAVLPKILFRKPLILEINGIASEERRLSKGYILNEFYIRFCQMTEYSAGRYAEKIISVTENIKKYFIEHYRIGERKINIIPNGVNTDLFYPIEDILLLNKMKSELGIDKDEPIVTFVGAFTPWQGVEYLIKSSRYIFEKYPHTKFLIIGDGDMRGQLEEKAKKINAAGNFIFTGYVPYEEVPKYINISDVCVAPFTRERNEKSGVSPLKIFGYAACRKAIVASLVPGLEFIENKNIGLLVEPENSLALADGIITLLNNLILKEELGSNGYRLIKQNYSWKKITKKVENVCQELFKENI